MQWAMSRTVLTFSSWLLAGYCYLIAALPWFVEGGGFFFANILAISVVSAGFLVYSQTESCGAMTDTGDWAARTPNSMQVAISIVLGLASLGLMLVFVKEKADGLAGYEGRLGAFFGLGFYWFGRLIHKSKAGDRRENRQA
jgi:hypothetical protein